MGKLFWLITGVALGFVGAHFVNQTTEGRRFFARVNRGMDELGRAFASGYREGDADDEDADAEALSAAIRERG
ncbi:hypothetical protein ACWGOE_08320 [Leucobacter chromiiresistens]|uniref:Uncharacterized protein n=1 Tax=Leucobacter chromiiresistens TaxID=1079994 RepID=A0A1H1A3V1_9MICO|nr:hypothetical protein [Leucobacter chromiiresistens]SDQ34347.1 hypothetical protein SAMN04488565_2315 [Leucobacter chromiiresistens]